MKQKKAVVSGIFFGWWTVLVTGVISGFGHGFYGYGISVFFKDLSASFDKGKINFIQGANGSGKSTLFRILQGKLSSNEILKGDFCLDEKCDNISGRIAMVQQKFDMMLADKFSFSENLKFANISMYPSLKFLPKHKDVKDFLKLQAE